MFYTAYYFEHVFSHERDIIWHKFFMFDEYDKKLWCLKKDYDL